VVDELETIEGTGYDRVWFADDCFTLNRRRLSDICKEITQRRIKLKWECLSRVDTVDAQLLDRMKQAGCLRLFYGIESGNDSILRIMGKQASASQARRAVEIAHRSGIKTGAFFIVGYPGETDDTILETVNFASMLPLDYIGFTMPYPIPATPLYETVKKAMIAKEYEEPRGRRLTKHKLLFRSRFSEAKLGFAILKASIQFKLNKKLGAHAYLYIGRSFERLSNFFFRMMR
jgi:anaerobic magnesium-protoporphyrin IX monomethyl ester cyclase